MFEKWYVYVNMYPKFESKYFLHEYYCRYS